MKRIYLLLTFVLCVLFGERSHAQDFSNKGKNFYISYPEHINGTGSIMGIYITSNVNTSGTITVNGTNIAFIVTANTITTVFLGAGGSGPNTYIHLGGIQDGIKTDAAVHITAVNPVVVYAHIINSARSGATLVLPTPVWGKEYIAPSYSNSGGSGFNQGFGEINIMAALPNTVVEITPSITTRNGARPAGVPYQVTLANPGDVYQVQFPQNADLSGTIVKSIASASSGCQPIAVVSATTWTALNCGSGNGGDNFYQQLFPTGTWGKEFLTTPLKKVATNPGDNNIDIVRVYVKDPATVVTKMDNGITTTLAGLVLPGNFYEYTAFRPTLVSADKPVQVMQFVTTQNCGFPTTQSDPEMISLSAVEQTINDITVYSAFNNLVPGSNSAINTHYINVAMKTANTGTFRINGAVPGTPFITIPGTNFSYLKHNVSTAGSPVTRLTADSGFSAIAYGFGNVESYGYNAGTNVKDLYQQIGVSTQFGIEPTPSVCKGSPFQFKVSLPYCVDSIRWDLSNLPWAPLPIPPNPIEYYNTCDTIPPGSAGPDSITVVNGKTLYWYSLPSFYTFNTSGTFNVSMFTYAPNTEGCGNEQEIPFELNVFEPPVADFSVIDGGCVAEVFQFNDNTVTPRPSYIWEWNFDDIPSGANNLSGLQDPTHTFTTPGIHNVTFRTITTPGCISSTISKPVYVSPLPSATIAGTTTLCLNEPFPDITFTATDGTAPYTFYYTIDNGGGPGPVQTVNSVVGNTATVSVPTGVAGTFRYDLVSVRNTGSALCVQPQTGTATVIVNPLPTAAVSGAITVCKNAPPPDVTFTGGAGTAPYTFTYNINGGPSLNITTVSGNSVTVSVPTGTAGTFVYNLVSVSDASATICSQLQSGSTTVTVNELPTASIAGTIEVCRNATPPTITFTGAGTSIPYTFTYNINGGPNLTVTAAGPGPNAFVLVPTGTPGTYTYNLLSVVDGTSATCSQAQTGSATVIVHPLPTASIAGATAVCVNATPPDVTFTGAGGVAPYTFTYNINGGPILSATTVAGNSVTVPVSTAVAGTFNYNLVSVQNSGAVSCIQAQTGTVTVVVNPLPTAAVSGAITVCKNAPSPNVTFTGAAGTAPYTFTYNINGGPSLNVTTVAGNSVTVAAPTGTAGSFTYNLVSVQDASATLCSQSQTGSTTVIVNDLPTASVAAATTEVCLNGTAPLVTFTGAGTSAPYTFTYTINGGPNLNITTVAGNSVSVSVPTGTAGTFTYNLVSVSDGTATLCSQAQTGSAVVIVHPLPTPDFNVTIPSCETQTLNFTDLSNPNVGTSMAWTWNFGDASPPSNVQNPTHTYAAAGPYTVSLSVTNSKGCVSNPILTRTINVHAKPVTDAILPEVCLDDTFAQFYDNSTVATPGSIVSWLWDFGDPGSGAFNTSTLEDPQHSYTATGIYTITLTTTSNNGCATTQTFPFTVNGDIPISDFTPLNTATMCANDSVSIRDAATVNFGSITKVEIIWDFIGAPGVIQTDDTPTPAKIYKHKYPTTSTTLNYTIRYIAYSGGTCLNTRDRVITVNAAPKVQFLDMPDACLDAAPFQITQASEIGGVAGPPGVFSGPGVTATGIFNPALVGPGTYMIKYTFTATAGGCLDSLSKPITVLDSASARFTYSTLNCQDSPVSFNSTSSTIPAGAGTITGWTWDFGDPASGANNASSAQNPTHTFSGWGTYNVRLFVTTSNNCRSTVLTVPVFVNPIPRPSFTIPASACLPSATVTFNSGASSIPDGTQASFSYLWDFGDPASGALNSSTNSSPSHIYNTIGPFFVNLQITSGAGCVHDTMIVLNTLHPQPTGDFAVDKNDICIGQSFQFTDNSDPADGTITQWNWNMDDGNTRNAPTFSYTYGSPRTYNVTLSITNNFGCRSTVHTETVTVNPYPVVDAGPDLFILQGGSDTLEPIITSVEPTTYLWTPNLYFLSSNTIKMPVVKGVEDIRYLLTVTSRGNCTDTSSVFIKVLKGPEIPNIFSPNGDGVHDRWVIKYLDTYPGGTVDIYNRYGQLIFHSVGYAVPWDGTVNGQQVPIGTYYYVVNPKNGRTIMSGYVDVIR
ncbi:MAG: PKD domain-containing protein [Chitinophagaceae bacterium]